MNQYLALGIVDQDTVVIAFVIGSLGLLLILTGYFGLLPTLDLSDATSADNADSKPVRMASAGGCLALVFLLTGWPAMALFGGAAGWQLPTLRATKRKRREAIDKVDAVAIWVETIRDNISGAAGLTQALRRSATTAPEPIRTEVRDLVLRLQHEPLVPTLRRFAADLAHPTSDMAVACLILASTRSAGSLSEILAQTAHSARDNATMMRNIDAGRRKMQSQAKTVTIICVVMSLLMIFGGGEFVEPYNSFTGQIVLFGICTLASFSAVAIHRLGRPVPQKRVFAGVERGAVAEFGDVPVEEFVEA